MNLQQQLRPATEFPILTVMVGLKRDLLRTDDEARSREYGDLVSRDFGDLEYFELSAKTRQGMREFWYGLIRKLREARLEAWREEVRKHHQRREEMEGRERAYLALTGEKPDGRQ